MTRNHRVSSVLVAPIAAGLSAGAALAQYSSDFEALNATANGEILTGQDGYYLPSGVMSVDFLAYTYAGNALGVQVNPVGGDQFIAGEGPGNGVFARAQRDLNWGSGVWRVTYDACALYLGTPPSANNVGSFSAQPYPGSASYIHLFSWVDINAATNWQAFYLAYDAAGGAHTQPGQSPGPEWTNLDLNEWYRFETVIDFDQNRITEVSIEGLTLPLNATFNPSDWYLEGGSNGGSPLPTGLRFFGGGGVPGNVVAWDNISVEPSAGGVALTLSGVCPGTMTASVSGATPGGTVAFIRSFSTGSCTLPPGPCEGTELGLSCNGAALVATDQADAQGNASISGNAAAGACGRVFLQAIDISTCSTSNVEGV